MRLHPRTMAVAQASADIGVALTALQREHGLTDAEMLLAVFAWERGNAEAMLRAERSPTGTGRPGSDPAPPPDTA